MLMLPSYYGATENAGMENVGPNRMGGNRRTGKRRTKIPGVEKAGLENAGTSCVWAAKHNIINVHVVRGHVRVVLKRMCSNSEQTFQQSYG